MGIIKALVLILALIYLVIAIGFYFFLRSEDYLKSKSARLVLGFFLVMSVYLLYGYFTN